MFNLISVLLSLALMLTGAAAPGMEAPVQLDAPVARTITLSDINLSVNDQQVALTPTASFGVMTDGAQAVYDFAITAEEGRLLPLQLKVDESGIVLANENSGLALKLTAEELEQLIDQQLGGALGSALETADGGDPAIMTFMTEEYLPAYAEMLKLLRDSEQVKALKAQSEQLMDEIVDRGEGVPGEIEVDGETVPVTTYTYTLDGPAMGRLADRVYDMNEVLSNYRDVYFRLIQLAAKDAPELEGIDSMEKVMSLVDMHMDVVESVAEDGRRVSDIVFTVEHIKGAEDMPPMVYTIQGYEDGDNSQAVMDLEYAYQDFSIVMNMEVSKEGDDVRMSLTLAGNGLEDAGIVGEAEDAEDDAQEAEEETEAEAETDAEAEAVEETDAEAEYDFYTMLTLYSQAGGAEDERAYGVNLYVESQEVRGSFDVTGLCHGDGTSENAVTASMKDGDDYFDFTCALDVSAEPIRVYADAEKASSIDAFDSAAMAAHLTTDAVNLSLNDSVQQLIGLFMAEVEEDDAVVEDDDALEDDDEVLDLSGRNAEPYDDGEVAFGIPQFNWVPEGYRIEAQDVDTQYDMVSFTFVNPDLGTEFTVDFFAGSDDESATYYSLNDDGAATRLDGLLVTEEKPTESIRAYSLEDGVTAMVFTVFSDDVDADAVFRMISNISY